MIREAFFSTTPDFPVWLLRLVFSVTLVGLVAATANLLLGRSSAALRHRVWALAVAACLALPALILLSPEIRLGWLSVVAPPVVASQAPTPDDKQPAPLSPAIDLDPHVFQAPGRDSNRARGPSATQTDSGDQSAAKASPSVAGQGRPQTDASSAPVTAAANAALKTSRLDANVVWFLVLVLPAIWGIWNSARAAIAARRVASEGKPIHDRDAQLLVTDLCRRLRWKRGIELRQSSCTPIPLCVGWRRPCILLPPQWKSWGEMTLRAVLAHEVSHVVRYDVAWQFAARIACCLYWFHPLVWLAARKMRVERESACDDRVLGLIDQPVDYASVLLRFAREMVARSTPSEAVAMASVSGLEGRVRAILDKKRHRAPVGTWVGRFSAAAALLIAASAAALSPLSREISSVAGAAETVTADLSKLDSIGAHEPAQPELRTASRMTSAGELAGRVVLKSNVRRGVGKARILGIPENPKASYVTAIADAQGNFRVKRDSSAMLFLAQNDERTLSGIARIEPDQPNVVIPVLRPVNVRGRLLNSEGRPLGSWPLEYCLVLEGSFLDDYHLSQTRDAKRLLGGGAFTAPNGDFTLPGLAPGFTYRISCCPGTVVNGAIQPYITITTFTTTEAAETRLGDVKRPRTSTVDDVFLGAASPIGWINKVYESTAESARWRDQRVLLIAGARKQEIVSGLRSALAVSSPTNWTPGAPPESGPAWAKETALQAALLSYAVFAVDPAGGGGPAQFLEEHKVAAPAADDFALAVLDFDGRLVSQTTGQQLFGKEKANVSALSRWLLAQAPKLGDAKQLLADALAQAKRDNKRVFLREDSPQDGAYGSRFNQYVAQYKELLEKDYVCVKIDTRCKNADEVVNHIRDFDINRDYGAGGYSLPWMIILDDAGKPLVSGTSPHGNIGIPESAQETSYFAWMLRATSQRLADEEITELVSGMNKMKR